MFYDRSNLPAVESSKNSPRYENNEEEEKHSIQHSKDFTDVTENKTKKITKKFVCIVCRSELRFAIQDCLCYL
ncbi:CLUMA_CG005897, isoform A [Clunio marinus]|uniref:CLUMA_CG005897, isoform A n=1 Tax=Clunio marinus TaxID=568069 RepID=A0A1J1HY74_9DIPT|nr:CLUMA_CG005897, isoform A [Clunio marinus]